MSSSHSLSPDDCFSKHFGQKPHEETFDKAEFIITSRLIKCCQKKGKGGGGGAAVSANNIVG